MSSDAYQGGLQVFGAGFGRTGTYSLKLAFQELGYGPCYHMSELIMHPEHVSGWLDPLDEAKRRAKAPDWSFLNTYKSSTNWPVAVYWKELIKAFPDAKVVLTVRDPDTWYASCRDVLWSKRPAGPVKEALFRVALAAGAVPPVPLVAERLLWERVFGGRFPDAAAAKAAYTRHNAAVRAGVPLGRLLVFDVKDGWEPLCRFLGKEVPAKPFPCSNSKLEGNAAIVAEIVARKKRQAAASGAARRPRLLLLSAAAVAVAAVVLAVWLRTL